ncbi:MAG: hypothetical protein NZO58_08445, partial [Gemmataceae bacterium]|nr:hypothetical protein [Gemmataceae bacterium]
MRVRHLSAWVCWWGGAVAAAGWVRGDELAACRKLLPQIRSILERELPSLEQLYRHLHAHPELAFEEEQTAARLAKEMRQLGFEVAAKVGGHGIVCLFKNGPGPTVMVRTDLDALPITENTGL